MRRLLNTLYVTEPDRYLSLDGENVVVLYEKTEVGRVPLHNLEAVVSFGYTGVSPALMGACAARGVALSFLSGGGRFLARVSGETHGNVTLRRQQYRYSDDSAQSVRIARNCIAGKLCNARWVLERAARDYPLRLDAEKLRAKSAILAQGVRNVRACADADTLRGLEGEAAAVYFSVFDDLILQQKEAFSFCGRSKRPPLDPVNALLSFAYTLLAHMCGAALETAGLDPYVGFFHTDRPGRMSLALDLMEELRCAMADRFVLTLINNRIVKRADFTYRENGAVLLSASARRSVLKHWQERKRESLTHPYLGEQLSWGMVPYIQALLLARTLREDLDAYPPFLWK